VGVPNAGTVNHGIHTGGIVHLQRIEEMKTARVDLQKVPWKLYRVLGVRIRWPEGITIDDFLKQKECIVTIEIPEYGDKKK